jgi:hypothetical protein
MVDKPGLIANVPGIDSAASLRVGKVVKSVIKFQSFPHVVDLKFSHFACVNNHQIILVNVFTRKSSQSTHIRIANSDVLSFSAHDHRIAAVVFFVFDVV